MKPVPIVTTVFPTLSPFIGDGFRRLAARGARARGFALRGAGRHDQTHHAPLVGPTESAGSPLALRAWAALLVWLLRCPGALLVECARVLRAARCSPCVPADPHALERFGRAARRAPDRSGSARRLERLFELFEARAVVPPVMAPGAGR